MKRNVKRLFKRILTGFLFLMPVLFLSGCVRETEKAKTLIGAMPRADYVPLKDYQLELKLVSPSFFPCGRETFVTYSLKNTGKNAVCISDWFSVPEANVKLFCQPWTPDMTKPDPNGWVLLGPDYPARIVRYPLELNPGNLITVQIKLPFVEFLEVQPGTERRYFIRAELNLKTVKASSRIDVLHVRSAKEK